MQGIKLAVCSAATKSSVVLCLENLIGLVKLYLYFPFCLFRLWKLISSIIALIISSLHLIYLQERFQGLDCFLAGIPNFFEKVLFFSQIVHHLRHSFFSLFRISSLGKLEMIFLYLLDSAGDDVKEKKPNPMIYVTAAKVISLLLHRSRSLKLAAQYYSAL